jgi:hypothetical protein
VKKLNAEYVALEHEKPIGVHTDPFGFRGAVVLSLGRIRASRERLIPNLSRCSPICSCFGRNSQ